MTRDIDYTPHAIFNTFSDTCWKVIESIDFDLKNRNSELLACFSALICDFSQFIKNYENLVLRIFENVLFMAL